MKARQLWRVAWVVIWLMLTAVCGGADWPQFGGLRRDFTSPETGLARSWPEAGPRLLWRAPLNKGFAGAAIHGNEVFLFDQASDEEVLLCLDLATGRELWRYGEVAPNKIRPAGARATPAVDEDFVFTCGTTGRLNCIERQSRNLRWRVDLVKAFDGKVPQWGFAQNPALWKDLVIVAPQGRQGGVAAFERATGRVVWKSPYLRSMITGSWHGSYVSPAITVIDGVPQAIMATAHGPKGEDGQWTSWGVVAGISLEDGSVLWSYEGWQSEIPIPAPVPLGDGRVFLTAAYEAGSALIEVRKQGQQFQVRELFKTMECASQIQQPIFFGDHLYVVSNGKERKEGLLCLGLDGQVKWHTTNSSFCAKAAPGLPNFECGNLLLADGMLFLVDGRRGDLYLIEPRPDGYRQLACAKQILDEEGDGQVWAPMALSQGKLLLRDQWQMKCLDVRRP
jgi:outer membrane protein assembly factor BamB